MQNLVSKVPMMVVEGNHEIEEQAFNRTFVAYSSRFAFPSEESGSSSKFYYSFNAGGIHFIMLGAYIGYDKSGILLFSIFPFTLLFTLINFCFMGVCLWLFVLLSEGQFFKPQSIDRCAKKNC